jgi:hypothetical protein
VAGKQMHSWASIAEANSPAQGNATILSCPQQTPVHILVAAEAMPLELPFSIFPSPPRQRSLGTPSDETVLIQNPDALSEPRREPSLANHRGFSDNVRLHLSSLFTFQLQYLERPLLAGFVITSATCCPSVMVGEGPLLPTLGSPGPDS